MWLSCVFIYCKNYVSADQFGAMKKAANHFVVVIEDVTVGKIISSATLLIEHKFIHRASQVSNKSRLWDLIN